MTNALWEKGLYHADTAAELLGRSPLGDPTSVEQAIVDAKASAHATLALAYIELAKG